MSTSIEVSFTTSGTHPFLMHKQQHVPLDAQGKGSFTVEDGKWDVILFGIEGAPGATATITLSVPAPKSLEIAGHPIVGKIADGKTVWGSSRFFRVK